MKSGYNLTNKRIQSLSVEIDLQFMIHVPQQDKGVERLEKQFALCVAMIKHVFIYL